MTAKKESLVINCTNCNTRFRLWIPADMASSWEKGAFISCINCGMRFQAKKDGTSYIVHASGTNAPTQAMIPPAPAPALTEPPAPAPAEPPAPVPAEPPSPAPPEPAAYAPPPAQTVGAVTEAKATVLIIEDDSLARQMVDESLQGTGIRVLPAKNATEALSLVRSEKIDLLVTDLYLRNPNDPDSQLDGEELLRKISASGIQIPAIITTGKDIIDDIVLDPKWFDLRVKGFIQKGNPFWVDELKLKIKEVLHNP